MILSREFVKSESGKSPLGSSRTRNIQSINSNKRTNFLRSFTDQLRLPHLSLVSLVLAVSLFFSPNSAKAFTSPFPNQTPIAQSSALKELKVASLAQGLKFDRGIRTVSFDGNVFVVERGGRIFKIIKGVGGANPTKALFIDNTSNTNLGYKTYPRGDCGLLGVAFHPNKKDIYTFGCEIGIFSPSTDDAPADGTMAQVLRRWRLDPLNANQVLPDSEVLIRQTDMSSTHAGGGIRYHVGPDNRGHLYVAFGDEGPQRDVTKSSQRIDHTLFSSIIKIDVGPDFYPDSIEIDPATAHSAFKGGYRIPVDNPYIGKTSFNGSDVVPEKVIKELYIVGLRNPYSLWIDPLNSHLYAFDVGFNKWESVKIFTRGGQNGGWAWYEGKEATNFAANELFPGKTIPTTETDIDLVMPAFVYPHTSVPLPSGANPDVVGNCVIGGFIYRGTKFPELRDSLIFGDCFSKSIFAMRTGAAGANVVTKVGSSPGTLTSLDEDPNGEVLASVYSGDGPIYELTNIQGSTAALPQTLSATGIFTDLNTMQPADGVYPFEVNTPFWSDGAHKTRWLALPNGTQMTFNVGSDLRSFPVGSVFVKHFDLPWSRSDLYPNQSIPDEFPRRPIETRIVVKTADGVYGLSYKWRADGSDADLVPEGGATETYSVLVDGGIKTQNWRYPSRSDCLTCHNPTGGHVLGLTLPQLNKQVSVGEGNPPDSMNQLEAFMNLGVLNIPNTNPATFDPASLPKLAPATDEEASLELRVRSYLASNCSYCHAPNGLGQGGWDGRFQIPMESELKGLIGKTPANDLGVPGSQLVYPSDPAKSALINRIRFSPSDPNHAGEHMPPLATDVVNHGAVDLLSRWVLSLPPLTNAPSSFMKNVGTNGPVTSPHAEFTIGDGRNNLPPGSPAKLDDDYYFAGTYPVGYNGITGAPLVVTANEPWTYFERSFTTIDRFKRIHTPLNVASGSFEIKFSTGGEQNITINAQGVRTYTQISTDANLTGKISLNGNVIYTGPFTPLATLKIPFGAVNGPAMFSAEVTTPNDPTKNKYVSIDYINIYGVSAVVVPPVLPERTEWALGTYDTGTVGRSNEFTIEPTNPKLPPGDLAGSVVDNDYYFKGTYPVGFNSLAAPRTVANDDPTLHFARAITAKNPATRIHFTSNVEMTGVTLNVNWADIGVVTKDGRLTTPESYRARVRISLNGSTIFESTDANGLLVERNLDQPFEGLTIQKQNTLLIERLPSAFEPPILPQGEFRFARFNNIRIVKPAQ